MQQLREPRLLPPSPPPGQTSHWTRTPPAPSRCHTEEAVDRRLQTTGSGSRYDLKRKVVLSDAPPTGGGGGGGKRQLHWLNSPAEIWESTGSSPALAVYSN